FFFQAEDGIRDLTVTGVQTCALPILEIRFHNLRDWTKDRHKTVDDRPFGGGEGMLLKPEPIFEAVETIWPERKPAQKVVLLSARSEERRVGKESMVRRLTCNCREHWV